MKLIAVFICLLCFGFLANAQISCTIVLKDRSVLQAYHLGSTEICKKGRKKTNTYDQQIFITGIENNQNIVLDDLSLIEEIRIDSYNPISRDAGTYCLSITVKFKNGDEHKLNDAKIQCMESNNEMIMSVLPIQIKQNNENFQQVEVNVQNIETLIF